jgi:hypothetical protein
LRRLADHSGEGGMKLIEWMFSLPLPRTGCRRGGSNDG